eukprot:SAG11_NODE_14087_length_625_cov_1.758555_2_plen_68_part_01
MGPCGAEWNQPAALYDRRTDTAILYFSNISLVGQNTAPYYTPYGELWNGGLQRRTTDWGASWGAAERV